MSRKERRRPLHDPEAERERALIAELRALYRDVDAAYAGYGCPGETDCCRFAVTGREPYVTSLELALVEKAIAARGGALSPRRRALPLHHDDADEERICPLLTRERRCLVYADRPLGCRSYWCHRASPPPGGEVDHRRLQSFVRRLQEIAARHRPDGDRGRPLTRASFLKS